MAQKLKAPLKLGVIGMSEGNGHPYSWSAIFNGYDAEYMKDCSFPGIPDYLSKQSFPEDGLSHLGSVTHIWTQSREISEHIAKSSLIKNVVEDPLEMIGKIDALLLARDDAENHAEMALPFLKAGIPIFIDKPFAINIKDAKFMLENQVYSGQIFTCSSLKFAKELLLSKEDLEALGEPIYVEASVVKYWETYGIHLLDPIVTNIKSRGDYKRVKSLRKGDIQVNIVEWENLIAIIKSTGKLGSPIKFKYFGEKGSIEKVFVDSFNCFKKSLQEFIEIQLGISKNIPVEETMELVKILEEGRC